MAKLTERQRQALDAANRNALNYRFDVWAGEWATIDDGIDEWRVPSVTMRSLLNRSLVEKRDITRPYSGHRHGKYALTEFGRAALKETL